MSEARPTPPPETPPQSQFLGWLGEVFFNNFGYKLASLAIAVSLWAVVQEEQDVEENAQVFLHIKVPEKMVLLSRPPVYASVKLVGPRKRLKSADERSLEISIDLSGNGPGDVNINLADRFIRNLPADVTVADISPSGLQLGLDRKVEKLLPVELKTRGEAAEGYYVSETILEPSELLLEGAAGELEGMAAIPTEVLDLSGLKAGRTAVLRLDFGDDKQVWSRDAEDDVRVRLKVLEAPRELELVDVPVLLAVDAPEGLSFEPQQVVVTLQGPAKSLAAVERDTVGVELQRLPTKKGGSLRVAWQTEAGPGPAAIVVLPQIEGLRVKSVEPHVFTVRFGAMTEPSRRRDVKGGG